MSKALHTDILGIACFDSDFLFMKLIDSDGNIDAYAGVGYCDADDLEFCEDLWAWEYKASDFSRFLDCVQEEYVFAEEVLSEIAPCVNLPVKFSNCGFDYMDELPDGERISYLYFIWVDSIVPNERIDKITGVTNLILGILYLFLSLFSFFGGVVSELTIDATDPLYITLVLISSKLFLLNWLISLGAVPVALILKKKGYSLLSLLPTMILCLVIAFLGIVDHIPSAI